MMANLKPRFIRFPGGPFVEGGYLRDAFRWKETIGPWEERSGTIMMLGITGLMIYFELLQLAEDLGALPVWVFNSGISHSDCVDTAAIFPFVQEALDGIEFARGDPTSKWGSIRTAMGHPAPFDLKYVTVGNERCGSRYYRGNFLEFYGAIKNAYPDVQIITNCKPRGEPKAFVSEYYVQDSVGEKGNLYTAIAEAEFLIGLENHWWTPDAISFNSYQVYGTSSYWAEQFFIESSGATLLETSLTSLPTNSSLVASAITWNSSVDSKTYLRIKVVNFGVSPVKLNISLDGFDPNSINISGTTKTVLTSANQTDQNSFSEPNKVVPIRSLFQTDGMEVNGILIPPFSLSSFDFERALLI